MPKTFRKTVLRVGDYHSPDGIVRVTPERLRHWSSEHARMTAANQVVPMHWDHSNNLEELSPVSLDLYDRKERSAANSVGRMTSITVNPDGQSADIHFEVADDAAIQKVETNTVYVSPVIFPAWKDGAGNQYTDVFTHLDLVNHPVDHSQGPSIPVDEGVLAMGLIRMGIQKFSLSTEAAPASPLSPATAEQVIEALSKFGLQLPADTTESNLLDRILTAAIAATGAVMPDQQATPTEPQIATMSLQSQQALAFAEKQHRKSVTTDLDALLASGRCTPAEHKQFVDKVNVLKLSLNAQGEPSKSDVETFIESRQPVPQGTFWDADQKLKRMSVVPHPSPASFGDGQETKSPDEIADYVLGK
jgi:hypothetical protein